MALGLGMFRAILILLFALLLTSPAHAMVYLNHNPGGNVAEFMQDVESVGESGDEVVINGEARHLACAALRLSRLRRDAASRQDAPPDRTAAY